MSDDPDLSRWERREWWRLIVQAFTGAAVLILAVAVLLLVFKVQDTAEDTNDLVVLLEDRTPLFAELQASENRTECIVETLARGLAGYAAGDDEALADSARSLLALGTPDDPCPPRLEEP